VFGSLIIGYARNPSLKQQLFSYAILGKSLNNIPIKYRYLLTDIAIQGTHTGTWYRTGSDLESVLPGSHFARFYPVIFAYRYLF
jgi:hypothetical protein